MASPRSAASRRKCAAPTTLLAAPCRHTKSTRGVGGRADLAGGNEQELRLGIDEAADEPRTRDPVDPRAFTSDPSHDISPLAEQVFVLTLAVTHASSVTSVPRPVARACS